MDHVSPRFAGRSPTPAVAALALAALAVGARSRLPFSEARTVANRLVFVAIHNQFVGPGDASTKSCKTARG